MNVQIREVPRQKAVCMAHPGPFYLIGQTFTKLAAWKQEHPAEYGPGISLFYNDPETTRPEELRSDAGAIVPQDFEIQDLSVHIVEVEGGPYAVGTYPGAYDGLPNAWGNFFTTELPSGYTYRFAPTFEVYAKMGKSPDGSDAVTELYLPLRREGDSANS